MNILVIDQDDDFCVEIASMLCVHDVLGATTCPVSVPAFRNSTFR